MEEPRLQAPLSSKDRVVSFGAFELFLDTGELRKHGIRVKLQGKPFQILSALLEEPGRVVTRDELRTRLWPVDMFVDFESGLNSAINRLRITLGDSAEHPIYVETLARMGYRFIAPTTMSHLAPRKTTPPVTELPRLKVAEPAMAEPIQLREAPPVVKIVRVTPVRLAFAVLIILLLIVSAALTMVLLRKPTAPSFRQVTFRKGFVENARFTPGGESIVYSAQWSGAPSRLYLANTVSPEARDLGLEGARLAGLSPRTEMAFFTRPPGTDRYVLEDAPLHGGAPRFVSDHTISADWAPDGTLCEVILKDSAASIEFPPGRKIYNSRYLISDVRVSPKGDWIAFLEHPIPHDDAGQVTVINLKGEARVLSAGWGSADGLAWNPAGTEIWFSAARAGVDRALMAVDLQGRIRQIAQVPGNLQLHDIAVTGKVLVSRTMQRMSMLLGSRGTSERDISWLDWSSSTAVSNNGKLILFDESGEGGGQQYSTYLYRTDTKTSERLGEGRGLDLSADGKWVLTQAAHDLTKLTLISVDSDVRTPISGQGFEYRWAKFYNGGNEILILGNLPSKPPQVYKQKLPDGRPVLLKAGLQLQDVAIDDAGRLAAGINTDGCVVVLDLESGATRPVKTSEPVSPIVFVDGRLVLTASHSDGAILLKFLDLSSGKLTFYQRLEPPDMAGITKLYPVRVAKDLQTYVYSRLQNLSDLFVVSGWS